MWVCFSCSTFKSPPPSRTSKQSFGAEELLERGTAHEDTDLDPRLEYRLTGVVSHEGDSPDTGHYLAYVYSAAKRCWFRFDDSMVTRTSLLRVAKETAQNSYLFLYTHRCGR